MHVITNEVQRHHSLQGDNAYFPQVMLLFLITIPLQKLPPGGYQLFHIRKHDIETFLGCSEWLKL